MEICKQLSSKSTSVYMGIVAIFFGLLFVGQFVDTGDDDAIGVYFYFVVFILPIASVIVVLIVKLLSFLATFFGTRGLFIALIITLLGHIVGGLIGMTLWWPPSLPDLELAPWLFIPLSGLLITGLHFGWVVYCIWAVANARRGGVDRPMKRETS